LRGVLLDNAARPFERDHTGGIGHAGIIKVRERADTGNWGKAKQIH
jgi:hypothetical protein